MKFDEEQETRGFYISAGSLIGAVIAEWFTMVLDENAPLFWIGEGRPHYLVALLLVVSLISITILFIDFGYVSENKRYELSYIKRDALISPLFFGFFYAIGIFLAGLLAGWLFEMNIGKCLLTALKCILALVIFVVFLTVVVAIASFISRERYEKKLLKLKHRESEAHRIWDPIMLEAVNTLGIIDKDDVLKYCTSHLYGIKEEMAKLGKDFLLKDFFLSEGIDTLVKNGDIIRVDFKIPYDEKKDTSKLESKKKSDAIYTIKVYYKTKILTKLSEVSQEISLDDDN